jgi:hypothetical protein
MVPKIRSGQILFQSRHGQRGLVRNCEHYLNLETIMTDETTTSPEVMAGDVITQPGLYESRGGDIVQITGWEEGWWVSEWNGTVDWYGSDGRQRFRGALDTGRWDLLHWVRPLPASEAEPETTSEQLAEIEGQADTVQVREGRWLTRNGDIRNVTPTPPGHHLVDVFAWWDAQSRHTYTSDGRYHADGESMLDLLEYLGPIDPDKTQELPAYTPPEGWQLVPIGEVLNEIYIRPIEIEPEPEPEPQAADTAEELRSEVSYVQNLLGESRQRVTQLEELVASLRTINAAQEKAVVDAGKANDKHVDTIGQMQRELQQQHRELQKRALRIFDLDTINAAQEKAVVDAGKENTALRRQLAVVKAELTIAAAVSQQLQIELDAAQQVPADLPELRQLRLRLADMTLDRDQYKDAWNQIFTDQTTIRETTAAETVEAIIEWLQHFRGCNSPSLALLLLEALPHIIRNIVGLNTEDVE